MKNLLKQYFTFNNREKRGIFILSSIILLLLLVLAFQHKFSSQDSIDFTELETEIENFEQSSTPADSQKISTANSDELSLANTQKFLFNPNIASTEDWKKLGLSEKLINTINNYKNKGGKFYKKDDLKKIYGLSETLYLSLEPYILIPEKLPSYSGSMLKTDEIDRSEIGKESIDLNTADTTSLIKLKGIGSSFAKRIIKYRELLGGYINTKQLLEVYGFDLEKLETISPYLMVDTTRIVKINLNSSSLDQIKKHPYIKYNLAQLIVNYRTANGHYKSITDIKKLHLMNEELYSKLAPYLSY